MEDPIKITATIVYLSISIGVFAFGILTHRLPFLEAGVIYFVMHFAVFVTMCGLEDKSIL